VLPKAPASAGGGAAIALVAIKLWRRGQRRHPSPPGRPSSERIERLGVIRAERTLLANDQIAVLHA
jgi:hypothetical protein